jgi:hypothetical protein
MASIIARIPNTISFSGGRRVSYARLPAGELEKPDWFDDLVGLDGFVKGFFSNIS